MTVSGMSCSACRTHLIAYVHGDLAPRLRRRVAQHVNTCAACHSAYVEQRALSNELHATLRWMGQPNQPQLRRVWAGVRGELYAETAVRQPAPRFRLRYGFALLLLVVALFLPYSFTNRQFTLALTLANDAPRVSSATPTAIAQLYATRYVTEPPATQATTAPPAETPAPPR